MPAAKETKITKMLVVDDDPNILDFLKDTLPDIFDVDTAQSSDEAMKKIRSIPYEVVITDYKMPGSSGISLARKISEFDPEIPVVLMTVHGDEDLAITALRTRIFDFLDKPFEEQDVENSILNALRFKNESLEKNRKSRLLHEKEIDLKASFQLRED